MNSHPLACAILVTMLALVPPPPAGALLPNPWAAVGRLDIEGERFCTGTVIGEREVLTAAHCLFEPGTGMLIGLDALVFQVGLHDRDVVHSASPQAARFRDGYRPRRASQLDTLERDVAVLEFAEPLGVAPLSFYVGIPQRPTQLTTVRYGRSRPHRVTVDYGCQIGVRLGGLWQITCPGEQGNSGAPLLVPAEDGPRIAGVVVAVRTDARRDWMLAVPVDGGGILPRR